ncbi:MAG TPA: M20/M25/M40 family metallo-hydrolase [Gemmatimonadales bacterium]|nr:M20/M25/M40 family metallo-hydrolase [Gemmatimonadales bacterium]
MDSNSLGGHRADWYLVAVRPLARAEVAAAADWLRARDRDTLDLQQQIAAIPAPTFDEGRRAAFVRARFERLGLKAVADAAGNVLAGLPDAGERPVVIAAHLDTVFDGATELAVRHHGRRIAAPGIGDNARGLAALLAVAEACVTCRIRAPLLFAATVGEEGLGDLRGTKQLFADREFRPRAFIALDGPGLDRVVHRAIGSRRLRATWNGPGGHSWAAWGVANPAVALGIAVSRMSAISLPASPRTTLTVARVGGGTSINTIPVEAWCELDIRSEGAGALEAAAREAAAALRHALEAANRSRASGTPALALEVVVLGERPCGATPADHPLVRAAVEATERLGVTPVLTAASTDANVPISLGIPAIALGAGGQGGDTHLTTEWYENERGAEGVVRALLVALSAAELP